MSAGPLSSQVTSSNPLSVRDSPTKDQALPHWIGVDSGRSPPFRTGSFGSRSRRLERPDREGKIDETQHRPEDPLMQNITKLGLAALMVTTVASTGIAQNRDGANKPSIGPTPTATATATIAAPTSDSSDKAAKKI